MTEIIINNLENENENPLVLETDNKKVFNCLRCDKKMYKKVLNNMICSICLSDLKKQDAEQKKLQKQLDKEELKKKKIEEQQKYLLPYDDNIKVYNETGEVKICNICNIEKHYKEYYCIRDSKSKYNRWYLNGKCKKCSTKTQITKSNKMNNIINNFLQNNNIIIN